MISAQGKSRASDHLVWRHWFSMDRAFMEAPNFPLYVAEQQGRGLEREDNPGGVDTGEP